MPPYPLPCCHFTAFQCCKSPIIPITQAETRLERVILSYQYKFIPQQCNALKCLLCRYHAVHLKKPQNSQILLQPIPYPIAISAPIFPAIPYPITQKHKKRGHPTRDTPLTLSYLARYPCPVPSQIRKRRIASNARIMLSPRLLRHPSNRRVRYKRL